MTYAEIQQTLKMKIPKSSLSLWCRNVKLPDDYKDKMVGQNLISLKKARDLAVIAKRNLKEDNLKNIQKKNSHLGNFLKNPEVGKIILAMIYVCEGSKNSCQSITLGNSDSGIIKTFLHLLRFCYIIDERKFRCTVQCRADQGIEELENFWSQTTKIPLDQFYKAQIDKRTIGKPSKRVDYHGVCRIDYFSAAVSLELQQIAKIIYSGC